MASYQYAIDQATFDISIGIRRRSWPQGDFIKIFYVEPPFPATVNYDGLTLEIFTPEAQDLSANDWERA